MADLDLDLDIANYNISDLERFFRLTPPYNEHDISTKESEIRTLLLGSGHIAPHFKRDLIMFLEEGKKILVSVKINIKTPTTIKHTQDPTVPHSYPVPNIRQPTRAENIIHREKTDFSYQQTSEFFPGILNPLDTRILKKCLSIDTRFIPINNSHSDFNLTLPVKLQKVVSMECKAIEIPLDSLYNISSALGNNFIYVSISAKEQDYNKVIVVPDGTYDKKTLLKTLTRTCSEQSNTPFVFLVWKEDPYESEKCILMIDNNTEEQYYLQKINHISLDFTVNIRGEVDHTQESCTRLGYLLGFTQKKYSERTSYMGECPINVHASLPYFYLSIDDYQNRAVACFQPAFSQNTIPPSILARISCNPHQKELTIVSVPRKYFGPIDISRLQVKLLDSRGKNIHLKSNFSFCLCFDVIYDL